MVPIVVLSIVFLLCPLLGYLVISADMSMRAKIIVAGISVVLLTLLPLVVVLIAGGSGSS